MTQKDHDDLLSFTRTKYISIFKNLDYKKLEIQDFFYNAFSKQPENLHKQIVAEIYDEYYEFIGDIQRKTTTNETFYKTCNCCKKKKDDSSFGKRYCKKRQFSYLRNICKECSFEKYHSEEEKLKRILNYEKIKECKTNWYKKNKKLCIFRSKKWRENNIEINREHQKKYREKTKEKAKEYRLNYYANNSEEIKQKARVYYQNKKCFFENVS